MGIFHCFIIVGLSDYIAQNYPYCKVKPLVAQRRSRNVVIWGPSFSQHSADAFDSRPRRIFSEDGFYVLYSLFYVQSSMLDVECSVFLLAPGVLNLVWNFVLWFFEFVSYFEFRISDFDLPSVSLSFRRL
jgi:hypothetical protein